MKREATLSKSVSVPNSRKHRYTKVCDNRKHPIRGLWRRGDVFYARLTVEDDLGRKCVKWVPLEAQTAPQAQEEFRGLLVERSENRLRPIGLSPLFNDYAQTYLKRLTTSGKKADTMVTETGHINRWIESLGHMRLDKLRGHHITTHCAKLRTAGKSARTCNLAIVCLRNVFKSARIDGFLKVSPADNLPWFKTDRKAHRLYSPSEIEKLCAAAIAPLYLDGRLATDGERGIPLKNGRQFADYIRFLQYSGAREQEALRIRWSDVSLERGHVIIGAEGDSKNREARAVDLNPELERLLKDMETRRAPDSVWLFPSPQRGEVDGRAKTFRESLLLTREAAGLPEFGFHDLRRFFASRSVMSGIDFLTVSRWLGHKDGGILLGKSYAHLADEHRKVQAQRIVFAPVVAHATS